MSIFNWKNKKPNVTMIINNGAGGAGGGGALGTHAGGGGGGFGKTCHLIGCGWTGEHHHARSGTGTTVALPLIPTSKKPERSSLEKMVIRRKKDEFRKEMHATIDGLQKVLEKSVLPHHLLKVAVTVSRMIDVVNENLAEALEEKAIEDFGQKVLGKLKKDAKR